ncbi:MAG: hypothetical protein KatS3mg011_1731 [Acidimicrobiia bacterium]|nr:MAG: hypothetical protein KatS3mg011_1731 [Acidimicrobiia bacterium]
MTPPASRSSTSSSRTPRYQKDLVQEVGLSQGQVSQHLACLTWCGLVEADRQGRRIRYRVVEPRVVAILDLARGFLNHTTADIAACRIIDREKPMEKS